MKVMAFPIAIIVSVLSLLIFFSGLVYVNPDEALVVISNYGSEKPEGRVLAEPGEIGIQKDVLGTGYHWIMPFKYNHEHIPTVYIPPKSIGVVTAKHGKIIQGDRYLAEKGEVGIQRRVLGPGTYRLNVYGYDVRKVPQTIIRPGFVGVLVDRQKGGVVQDRVLHPGVHYLNPEQYKIEIVDVGLKEYTKSSETPVVITDELLRGDVQLDAVGSRGKRLTGGSVTFPSQDGFTVGIDVTVLWELDPENAVQAVDTFGTVDDLVDRVIVPKFDSAARNEGSNFTAKEMIQGNTRAKFKTSFTQTLVDYTKEAPLDIVAALPRRVYVPVKIQLPIMQAQLKAEEMLTNKEIEETSKVEAKVEEQKKLVIQEIEQVKADTRVMRADIKADSEKEVGEYEAETRLMVSKIQLEIDKIQTKNNDIRSTAEAEVIRFRGEREAQLQKDLISAFGGAKAYNAYIFARESLPEGKLPVKILHSGEGTLWTDMKNTGSMAPLKMLKTLRENKSE